MAKFGVNLVRLHALDAPWQPRNLFGRTGGKRMIDPDPAMLSRLDELVAAFADSGIYVELTLLTGRDFSSADGLLVAATATLRVGAGVTRVTARALDPHGSPTRVVPVVLKDGIASFSVSAEYTTLWYLADVE
jgi:hypothetical protein